MLTLKLVLASLVFAGAAVTMGGERPSKKHKKEETEVEKNEKISPQELLAEGVMESDEGLIKMAIEKGANPNVTSFNPLVYAINMGNVELAKFLLQHGADLFQPMQQYGFIFYFVKQSWAGLSNAMRDLLLPYILLQEQRMKSELAQ